MNIHFYSRVTRLLRKNNVMKKARSNFEGSWKRSQIFEVEFFSFVLASKWKTNLKPR